MNIMCSLGQRCLYGFQKLSLEGETKPWKGGFSISIDSAVKEGLTFKRLEHTVTDVYEWMKSGRMGIKSRYFRREGEKWYQ